MKTQIDIKSTLFGIVVGVLAMFAIGAGTSSNPAGKYQIVASITPIGLASLVIDTQTGEVWGLGSTTEWNGNKPDKFWGAK